MYSDCDVGCAMCDVRFAIATAFSPPSPQDSGSRNASIPPSYDFRGRRPCRTEIRGLYVVRNSLNAYIYCLTSCSSFADITYPPHEYQTLAQPSQASWLLAKQARASHRIFLNVSSIFSSPPNI